jgi:hypothetical protein
MEGQGIILRGCSVAVVLGRKGLKRRVFVLITEISRSAEHGSFDIYVGSIHNYSKIHVQAI